MADAPPPDLFTRRVCLRREAMDLVPVRRDIPYGHPTDDRRVMDVYYPLGESEGGWPVVVIVVGYPGTLEPRPTPLRYKETGWTVSTAQLIASAGMAAVAYANCEPVADLRALLDDLPTQAAPLHLDASRLGIMAVSGNVPTALTAILRTAERPPACAVFGCGCLLDLDGATDVAEASRQFGFANACAGLTLGDFRRDVPLFVSRAGKDQFPAMNASIDRFVTRALAANLPITLVNHAEGPHGFDLFDDSRTSRDIVRQTLRFLRQHLTPETSSLEI